MRDPNDVWLRLVRAQLLPHLETFAAGWRDDGRCLIGPGSLAVEATLAHEAGPGHVDIGFHLDRNQPGAPAVWDCASGGRAQDDEAALFVAHVWSQTTAPCVFELLTNRGEFADHSHGDPSLGLAGWHSIHGPILGYGLDDAAPLQSWCLAEPVVPLLRKELTAGLRPGSLHGVKFLLGALDDGPVAEVRIDGEAHEGASRALLALPWPKDGRRVVRFFALFVHAA